MAERWMRRSHTGVRIVAMITLVDLGTGVISARYFPAFSRSLANGRLGGPLTFWAIATSVFLPFYVGVESVWMRNSKTESRALRIDAALALSCFMLLVGTVLYTFGHYAMF